MPASRTTTNLRHLAAATARRAYAPYSGRNDGVILVFDDGRYIPGVRVESATFSLTIHPLQNAATTAVALEAPPARAVVASRPFREGELVYAGAMPLLKHLSQTESDVLGTIPSGLEDTTQWLPFLQAGEERNPTSLVKLARKIGRRALVPESDFPVGCLIETGDGKLVPGVNVEHDDWMHILCAERNALGTVLSYGRADISNLYVSCLRDAACTPCGACRQLLTELAPASTLWMDRGDEAPQPSTPVTLLPGFFAGNRISRKT